jgi:hypothetical protein
MSAELEPHALILGVEISIFAPAHPPRFFPFKNKSSTRMFYKELLQPGDWAASAVENKKSIYNLHMP